MMRSRAQYNEVWRCRRERGGAMSFFLIILTVVIAGALATMAMHNGVNAQMASLTLKRDQAFYVAEAGMNRAMWALANGNWAGQGYPQLEGTVGNGTYTVTATLQGDGSRRVVATGVVPGAPGATSHLSAKLAPKYGLPAIALGGNFNSGGGVHVYGELQLRGNINKNGNFNMHGGNIYATGHIPGGIAYDTGYEGYPQTPDVPVPPDVRSIADMLRNTPGAVQWFDHDNIVFPPSGIVWFQNHWTLDKKNATITGEGTIVVYGTVTIKKSDALAGKRINIVCANDIVVLGGAQLDLHGSIYSKTNINSQSQFSVRGVIVANGDLSTQGQGSDVYQMPPPAWDPRLTGVAASNPPKFSNLTGPIF